MQRVSGAISVGEIYVNAVADNINSGFLDVRDGVGTGTGMVNSIYTSSWPTCTLI